MLRDGAAARVASKRARSCYSLCVGCAAFTLPVDEARSLPSTPLLRCSVAPRCCEGEAGVVPRSLLTSSTYLTPRLASLGSACHWPSLRLACLYRCQGNLAAVDTDAVPLGGASLLRERVAAKWALVPLASCVVLATPSPYQGERGNTVQHGRARRHLGPACADP